MSVQSVPCCAYEKRENKTLRSPAKPISQKNGKRRENCFVNMREGDLWKNACGNTLKSCRQGIPCRFFLYFSLFAAVLPALRQPR